MKSSLKSSDSLPDDKISKMNLILMNLALEKDQGTGNLDGTPQHPSLCFPQHFQRKRFCCAAPWWKKEKEIS